jgi:hypothetical protein
MFTELTQKVTECKPCFKLFYPNGGRLFQTDEFITTNQIMNQDCLCKAEIIVSPTTLEDDDEDGGFLKTALEENE